MAALSKPDAAMYWRSLDSANDQFLLYAFDQCASDVLDPDPIAELRSSAAQIADLHLGIERVPADLDYPRWVRASIDDEQWRHHDVEDWDGCLASVASLMTPDSRVPGRLWRVHVFGPLTGVPEARGPAMVVVLQIAHALGDGRRVSAIARRLLSGGQLEPMCAPIPAPRRLRLPRVLAAGVGAATTMPRLVVATAVGLAAWRAEEPGPQAVGVAATALNLPTDGPSNSAPSPCRVRTCDGGRHRSPWPC